MTDLLDQINQLKKTCRPRPTFTLERGRGETYSHPRPVLYAHSIYGQGLSPCWAASAALGGSMGHLGRGTCRSHRSDQGRSELPV